PAGRGGVQHGVAGSGRCGGGEPVAILRRDRLVEAEPRPRSGNRLGARIRADRLADEIARCQPREQKRTRRHAGDEEDREREPAHEVARQWTTATVSGRQSSWGRATDGVRLKTREEWAT